MCVLVNPMPVTLGKIELFGIKILSAILPPPPPLDIVSYSLIYEDYHLHTSHGITLTPLYNIYT